jgi:uncharacterized protein YaaN involved in tellurite resistance
MSENTDFTPNLTLEPQEADGERAALQLEPVIKEAERAVSKDELEEIQARRDLQAIKLDESHLSESEQKMVDDFSKKIDITNSAMVMQYGSAAQKNIAGFSEAALSNVRTKDLGEVGNELSQLVNELKGFGDSGDKKGGLFGLFKKPADSLAALQTKYSSAEKNVEKIVTALQAHQVTLMKDVAMLDQMYALNEKYYKELTMYILAGKKRLAAFKANELEEIRKKAEESGTPEDAQIYNDTVNLVNRFEKKIHDLELTRQISIQMGPQIRLLQNNDTLMIEKIQSSLVNTIPLWKNQMVLALGLEHSRQATKAQREVTEITNSMLKKNAETLHTSTVETAKESERSIIDIETLQYTNKQLIDTLDEVMKIQTEGAEKRHAAEEELGRIEGELRAKLMELNA